MPISCCSSGSTIRPRLGVPNMKLGSLEVAYSAYKNIRVKGHRRIPATSLSPIARDAERFIAATRALRFRAQEGATRRIPGIIRGIRCNDCSFSASAAFDLPRIMRS